MEELYQLKQTKIPKSTKIFSGTSPQYGNFFAHRYSFKLKKTVLLQDQDENRGFPLTVQSDYDFHHKIFSPSSK